MICYVYWDFLLHINKPLGKNVWITQRNMAGGWGWRIRRQDKPGCTELNMPAVKDLTA